MGRTTRLRLVAAMSVAVATTLGCSGPDDNGSSAPAPTEASTTATAGDQSSQEIEFDGSDGEPRTGWLFGDADADVAVVLSHMGSNGDSPDDWTTTAEVLADRGYLAMTFERPRLRYQPYRELMAAVRYVREETGAETVVAGGASLGAMASLYVALDGEPEVNAVVWVAGELSSGVMSFDEASVGELACPLIAISADQDGYGAAEDTVKIATWAPDAEETLLLPSSAHGTDILAEGGAPAAELEAAIVSFVDGVAAEAPAPC